MKLTIRINQFLYSKNRNLADIFSKKKPASTNGDIKFSELCPTVPYQIVPR